MLASVRLGIPGGGWRRRHAVGTRKGKESTRLLGVKGDGCVIGRRIGKCT